MNRKRVEANDANPARMLLLMGRRVCHKTMKKANALWLRAGELGCATAHFNVGNNYLKREGVENRDITKFEANEQHG